MTATKAALIRIDEAARLLGVREVVLRKLARAGKVPCAKLGGEWRFPADIANRVLQGEQRIDRAAVSADV